MGMNINFDISSAKARQKILMHREMKTIQSRSAEDLINDTRLPYKYYQYKAEMEDTVYDLESDLKPVPKTSVAKLDTPSVDNVNSIIPAETDSLAKPNRSTENRSDLIFSAYMRSGSTIIGKLFGNRFDTFYFFEPLWKVAKFHFYKGKESLCHYYNPNCVNVTKEAKKDVKQLNESLEYLQSIFDCTFHNYADYLVDKNFEEFEDEIHDWSFHKGYRWGEFKGCRQNKSQKFEACLHAVEAGCRSAEHRVIKLLRMTVDNLEILLQRNKNLKIIHLFRDPRGIFNSHLKTGWFVSGKDINDPNLVQKDAGVMCERMMIDLKAGRNLQEKYPDRMKFIQYEDLGSILKDKVHVLNEFVGMKYEIKQGVMIRKFFDSNRHSDKKGFHPYSYRNILSWEIVKVVDSVCAELLEQLGYTVYNSETHLRNLLQPAAVDPLPFAVWSQDMS